MAVNSSTRQVQQSYSRTQATTGLTEMVRAILTPLASLKLTVCLLFLATLVVWIITLEQSSVDIWYLKNRHFSRLFVFVPFTHLPLVGGMRGGFFLPSGITLISAMLINLTAAHLLRFRMQARGARMWFGIGVVALSSMLTWAVIFNGQNAQGFQGQPPIPWKTMWSLLQMATLGLTIACIAGVVLTSVDRKFQRIALGSTAAVLLVLLGISIYLGEDSFIGDSAMRILWQLLQSTVVAAAMLTGCILLFKRKAGIVLLHLGIAGLLVNEIYVSATNEEHRVSLTEGQTVHHAVDLRETELVVVDRSDEEFDEMTVIPGSLLAHSSEVIDDEALPFKIKTIAHYKNCDIVRVGPFQDNLANRGLGERYMAASKPSAAGADANAGVDKAGAYVELIDRNDDQSLGVYLVSQAAYQQGILDSVTVEGKEYWIGLRFKTVYPPYSLTLKDTQARYYVGTDIPSWFSSDFEITDNEHGITSDQRIWMNNPLRYRDQTFYQVTYLEDEDGTEHSGIQVVRNRGWMIPYVCCMFVVVGLVAQFQQSLSTFLGRPSRRQDLSSSTGSASPGSLASWLPTIVLMGIFGLYVGGQFVRSLSPAVPKAAGSGIRLDLLGQIPATHGGRVQPLDSYARNVARQLSNRELLKDGLGSKQPAIRWLADMVFGTSTADNYEVLRIEDPKIQNALGLPRRKGLKYTFAEIRKADAKLLDLLMNAEGSSGDGQEATNDRSVDPVFRDRLREVFSKSRMMMGVRTSFYGSEGVVKPESNLERLELAANLAKSKSSMPFVVATDNETEPWLPLAIVLERQWLAELAGRLDDPSLESLSAHLIDTEIDELRDELVKERIIADLLQYDEIVEGLSEKFQLDDPEQLAKVLMRQWHRIPEELYARQLERVEQFVDLQLARWKSEKMDVVNEMLVEVNGGDEGKIAVPDVRNFESLLGLKQAYVDGDAARFNELLQQHLTAIKTSNPSDLSTTAQSWELAYNHFSPFYMATILYVVGFVVTLISWIGFRQPMNRAAFYLICFALLIHIGGIVARIVISGRPPITNLYSSFVVVAAASVFILLVIEWFTRLGLGNLLAGACGFMTLLYAWTLSIDQGDTFSVLRAVLDTQFWLTTHVIIINLGYAATIVAGLVGVIYLLGSLLTKSFGAANRKTMANIIYGTVCFALLFSFFGTVLGGLWADDSWGRFWGWDPKENGALMIVLWNALILHARWAGLIRERGLAALAAFGNVITIWSWEGVNQLGVGLHAYGGVSSGAAAGTLLLEPLFWLMAIVTLHAFVALVIGCAIPMHWFRSYAADPPKKLPAG